MMSMQNKLHRREKKKARAKDQRLSLEEIRKVATREASAGRLYRTWLNHFRGVEQGQESCSVCRDYRLGICHGEDRVGEECIDCMAVQGRFFDDANQRRKWE